MTADAQWNWYATQELAGILAREGLCCPHCGQQTREIEVSADFARLHCRLCNTGFSAADYHAAQRRCPKTGFSTLYRPVGKNELVKIEQMQFRGFPPRLQSQPIFYPVLTQEYAEVIARDWNSLDPNHQYVGFVTRFQVRNEFLCNYEIQTAADKSTLEYWIPAEDIEAFNANIVGLVEIIAEFCHGQLVAAP